MTDARDARTHRLIGAGMEVHNILGSGFGEGVCRDGYAIELQLRGIPFMTEVPFPIIYKGHKLPAHYRADFVCFDSVVVELKVIGQKNRAASNRPRCSTTFGHRG
jgi:GxxExxY protein